MRARNHSWQVTGVPGRLWHGSKTAPSRIQDSLRRHRDEPKTHPRHPPPRFRDPTAAQNSSKSFQNNNRITFRTSGSGTLFFPHAATQAGLSLHRDEPKTHPRHPPPLRSGRTSPESYSFHIQRPTRAPAHEPRTHPRHSPPQFRDPTAAQNSSESFQTIINLRSGRAAPEHCLFHTQRRKTVSISTETNQKHIPRIPHPYVPDKRLRNVILS